MQYNTGRWSLAGMQTNNTSHIRGLESPIDVVQADLNQHRVGQLVGDSGTIRRYKGRQRRGCGGIVLIVLGEQSRHR